MNKYRFLFTGGGTGGHVYPNVAIYEALKEKYPDSEFLYVGSRKRSEAGIIPALAQPMKFVTVPTRGLPQNLKSFKSVIALATILLGVVKSFFILRKFRADVVIGSGGYVAAPVLLAAALLKQKVFIHEQNAVPGRLNLFIARFATKIGVAFPSTAYFFPSDRVICSGYPLRKAILSTPAENTRANLNIPEKSRVLFICSGSMGARTINRAAARIIPRLLADDNLFIIMSTGKAYGKEYKAYDDTVRILDQEGCPPEIAGRLLVCEYFDNIAEIYAISDLVASRAGAGAIKEITAMGLPAILIPKINLPADHQILNAREVEKSGGARILYEEIDGRGKNGETVLAPDALYNLIQELLKGDEPLAAMRKNIGQQEKQDSTAIIVEAIEAISGGKNRELEKELRLFYLQSLEDEQNFELEFDSTTIGNTFWSDIRLENVSGGRFRFEITFLKSDQNEAIIRRRRGRLRLNERDVAGWAELHEDDRIAIDGRTFIFKSFLEKIKTVDRQADRAGAAATTASRGNVLSSLGGFARAVVNAAIFGAGKAVDIFSAAWAIAGFLRRSVGENALKNIFLPIFQRRFQRGPRKKAWEAALVIANLTLLSALLLSAAGMVFAAPIVRWLLPGFLARGISADAVTMTRILFPCLFLATLAVMLATTLQAFGKFTVAEFATAVFALSSIAGMLLLLQANGLFALGYGMIVGGLLQILFLLFFVMKTLRRPELEFTYRPQVKSRNGSTRKYISQLPRLCSDAFLGRSADLVEKFLASSLASGSLSYLYFAMELFRLPLVLVSQSVDKVVFKDFSDHTALFEKDKTKKLFIDGIRINLFLLAPVTILVVFLAKPLVALLLERFHFSPLATANTALALQFYAIGLVGWGIHSLTARIFAARQDGRTATRLNFFMLIVHVALLVFLVKTRLRFAGIALAASISYLVFSLIRVIVLRRQLNREGMPLKGAEIIAAAVKTLSACLLMVIAIVEARFIFNRIHFKSPVSENLILCISLAFMGTAIYFLASLLFKNSGILVFKKKGNGSGNRVPVSLLSPFKFLERVSVNPDFFKNEYRYKINTYLANPAWEIKNVGIKLIGLFKEKGKVAFLVDMLSAKGGNGFMRRNALQALKALNAWNPEIRELLLRLLKDGYYEVRVAALDILAENISAAEYGDLKQTLFRKLGRGKIEEKTAGLRLIARKGDAGDLAQLSPLYLNSNSLVREELLELLYLFYRRGLLSNAAIKEHIEQVLITSNHLAPEFKIKSIINRIYREIDQP
ncbi:MAG: murein biosynthesis integral membrane protein MurJ [Candidatus Aminicenantes bacterium]|nr:murein biosynthesis integral membrane protein MurJ [Candidatus Aminicenantes bacterium]